MHPLVRTDESPFEWRKDIPAIEKIGMHRGQIEKAVLLLNQSTFERIGGPFCSLKQYVIEMPSVQ